MSDYKAASEHTDEAERLLIAPFKRTASRIKPTVDWSHKWQCFYLVTPPHREQITHALAKHMWDTDFNGAHWTPSAFRIMQEIVLA